MKSATIWMARAIILLIALDLAALAYVLAPQFTTSNPTRDQTANLPFAAQQGQTLLVLLAALAVLLILLWLLLLGRRGAQGATGGNGATPPTQPTYFLPNDVTLLVRHSASATRDDIIKGVQANPVVAPERDLVTALERARVSTTAQPNSSAISFLATYVTFTQRGANQRNPELDLIRRLNERIRQIGNQQGAYTVTASSPNWLSNSAVSHTGGVGGPGGQPVAPAGALPTSPATPPTAGDWQFTLPIPTGNGGAGVHVAILDTMPCHVDLKRAYRQWGATNPLMGSLLAPGGPLTVYPAGNTHLLQAVDYHLNAHEYPMPDHGLFIAGVVHSIAPNAQIHLIETLNSYGVGSLESFTNALFLAQSIARGDGKLLERVEREAVGQPAPMPSGPIPLVLNCSFVFNLPTDPSDPAYSHSPFLEQMWANLYNADEMVIVAAAGNDANGQPIASRPAARYPAAFKEVYGVAALDRAGNPTQYTDMADAPGQQGFATFGGVALPSGSTDGTYITDPTQGMLGVYSGQYYPDMTMNTNGWARWAGTSFAAPVIAGALALGMAPSGGESLIALRSNAVAQVVGLATAAPGTIGPRFNATQGV